MSGERSLKAASGIGCLMVPAGGLAGYASWSLSREAVRTCGSYISEGVDPVSWRFWELPLSIGAGALVAAVAYAAAGVRTRTPVAVLVALAALVLMAWIQFAWLGTPAGAGTTDKAVCPEDTLIPPWWPSWLPA